jgi:hypothetical protein
MESIEEMAINQATHKPLCEFCYINHAFVIWPHRTNKLRNFLDHLNSVNQNIQFTMKT